MKKKIERKMSGKGAVRAEKSFYSFIFNENMNDFDKIKKGVLNDRVTETVNDAIKKQGKGTFSRFFNAT